MDYSGVTFGLDVLVSILFGAAGALGVWFKLKGRVDIINIKIKATDGKVDDIGDSIDSNARTLHKRIDSLKGTVDKNRERFDENAVKITKEIHEMKIELLQAISNI